MTQGLLLLFLIFYLFFNLLYSPVIILLPVHPLTVSHPIPPSPISKRMSLPPQPPSHQTSPLPGASGLSQVRCIFSHWGQTRQTSAVYASGASYQLVYAAWLVAQCLRDLRESGLVETAGLPKWLPSSTVSSLINGFSPLPLHLGFYY